MSLPLLAFVLLGVAIMCCWAPPIRVGRRMLAASVLPAVMALLVALAAHLLGLVGLVVFAVLACACAAIARAPTSAARNAARIVAGIAAFALVTGKIPGFVPLVVIPEQILSQGAVAYARRIHFSGAFAGYLVLAMVARPADRAPLRLKDALAMSLLGAGVVVLVAAPMAIAAGYLAFDPRLPESLAIFASTIALFTAVPEEAFFRGLLQAPLHARLDGTRWRHATIPICAVAFGLAHAGGGLMLVALASLSGGVAAVLYARTRQVAVPVLMHTFVNVVHYTVFSYPRLS